MVRVTHKEEVICDICHKKIPELAYDGFFGTRFTMTKGIFGKPKHADICFDCQQEIIKSRREGGGDAT